MRLLLFQLQPESLERLGLAGAISERLDRVERRLGINVSCNIEDELVLPEDVEEVYYRITIESLNNSLKHANATEISVEILEKGPERVLTIADDGRGFEAGAIQGGMGLNLMRQRIEEIGGNLEVSSLPDNGTVVRAQVVLDQVSR